MKIVDIRKIALEKGLRKYGKLNKSDLIHAIQRAEKNPECFGINPFECGQASCLWREDCEKMVE